VGVVLPRRNRLFVIASIGIILNCGIRSFRDLINIAFSPNSDLSCFDQLLLLKKGNYQI